MIHAICIYNKNRLVSDKQFSIKSPIFFSQIIEIITLTFTVVIGVGE